MRTTVLRVLLVLYAAGSVAVVIPLVLDLAGDLSATTSGKVLAAALIALATGALLAIRDPWEHRAIVQVLTVFLWLAGLAILYRLLFEEHPAFPTDLVLLVDLAAALLFTLFSPQPPEARAEAPEA
ncbi:MAG TPA: hypothetical protein VMH50_15215 [Thermoleophilia bacterium]|nr:hypothetical protein [Thermoleophilia bacterium]